MCSVYCCGLGTSDPIWVGLAGPYEQSNEKFLDQLNDY